MYKLQKQFFLKFARVYIVSFISLLEISLHGVQSR